jgi:hypothetical protein
LQPFFKRAGSSPIEFYTQVGIHAPSGAEHELAAIVNAT